MVDGYEGKWPMKGEQHRRNKIKNEKNKRKINKPLVVKGMARLACLLHFYDYFERTTLFGRTFYYYFLY